MRILILTSLIYTILLLSCVAPATPQQTAPLGPNTAHIGDTVQVSRRDTGINMTLLSCSETVEAVTNGSYTYTLKPGMKFIIFTYSFKNDGVREQQIPHFYQGEVKTDRGYYYKILSSHSPYRALLPEDSMEGKTIFEIPEQQVPTEIQLVNIPAIIQVAPCSPSA